MSITENVSASGFAGTAANDDDTEEQFQEIIDAVAAATYALLAGQSKRSETDPATAVDLAVVEALRQHNTDRIGRGFPLLEQSVQNDITKVVTARISGIGGLAPLLADPRIEDIWANGCDNVRVQYEDGTSAAVPAIANSDEDLVQTIRSIAAAAGNDGQERRFDRSSPLLDLQLPGGERLHAALSVTRRPCLSIRRHRIHVASLEDLAQRGSLTADLVQFLVAAIGARMNIVLGGSTGSGKTTLMRAMTGVLPTDERIVTIEDAYELNLDADERHNNVVAMQARTANVEGHGAVSMSELFRAALRMNPSRVCVGEVRGQEAVVMLHAMSQGNDGSLSTIHASSSKSVFTKLQLYGAASVERYGADSMAQLISEAVDLVVYLKKDADGVRRVASIREVTGNDGGQVVSNELFGTPLGSGRDVLLLTPPSAARTERLTAQGWSASMAQSAWGNS